MQNAECKINILNNLDTLEEMANIALKLSIIEGSEEKFITYLFEKNFSVVWAGAFEENLASLRVMEKAGMKKTNSKASIEYRGKTHRCVYYCIKKEMKI